jgi:hypothetical protein
MCAGARHQDMEPGKAAKPQQSAEEVVAGRATPPAGDTGNPFGALPVDETA